MEHYAAILREAAERAGVKSAQAVAAEPGVRAVHRVTIHYGDMRASDTIVTLRHDVTGEAYIEAVYRGHFNNKPLIRRLNQSRYDAFIRDFTRIRFDKLEDQYDVALYGLDICLFERGAGGFVKGVIFSPQRPESPYAAVMEIIKTHLPEALREVR